ncbi:LPS export ABC transporter periplasmic protein LptC [Methylomagnum sp.]
MFPTPKSLLTYLVLALLAVGSWWASEIFMPKDESPSKPLPGKVDYYSKALRRTVMDEAGQPKELLVADSLTHYENDNHSELSHPVMTLYSKEGGPPWIIEAESAMLPGEGDDVYLYGEVLIRREADKNGRTIRIETSNARVQPERQYAETDEFVRMLSPPDIMTGTGAQVFFGDDLKFTVLSNVRRKHDVQPKK